MTRIMQQLGLGYLHTSRASVERVRRAQIQRREVDPAPPFLDEALLLYSRPLLDALAASPDHVAGLWELVEHVGLPIEDALRILPELERLGYVEVIERDQRGNHRLMLSPGGAAKLAG